MELLIGTELTPEEMNGENFLNQFTVLTQKMFNYGYIIYRIKL